MFHYDEHNEDGLKILVGKSISKIQMDEQHLIFTTKDDDIFGYIVYGDCCSSSYFYDFYGVERLLQNGAILKVETVELQAEDWTTTNNDVVQVYGFRFITNDCYYGEVSSVFSFRNDSNGYYGGSMYPYKPITEEDLKKTPTLTKDTLL